MKTVENMCDVKTVVFDRNDVLELLATNKKGDRNNRNLNIGRMLSYAKAMTENGWNFTGADCIVVDSNGILRNGQTRLNALLKSGRFDIPFLFARLSSSIDGHEAQKNMDCQGVRTHSQQLYLAGVKNSNAVSAIERMIAFASNGFSQCVIQNYEKDKIGEIYRDEINCFVRYSKLPRYQMRFTCASISACVVIAKRFGIERIDNAMQRIANNDQLIPGTSLHTIHRFLSKVNTLSQKEVFAKTFSCMLNYANGNEISKVYGSSNAEIEKFIMEGGAK